MINLINFWWKDFFITIMNFRINYCICFKVKKDTPKFEESLVVFKQFVAAASIVEPKQRLPSWVNFFSLQMHIFLYKKTVRNKDIYFFYLFATRSTANLFQMCVPHAKSNGYIYIVLQLSVSLSRKILKPTGPFTHKILIYVLGR